MDVKDEQEKIAALKEEAERKITSTEAANQLAEMLEMGLTTVAEQRGITDEELEAAYALAHDYYQVGNYETAETLFRFLTLMSHFNEKYWMGLAAVHQVKKRFKEALRAYAYVVYMLNLSNYKASYYAAECCLALGDVENATSAIGHVKKFADPTTEEGRTFLAKVAKLEKAVNRKCA